MNLKLQEHTEVDQFKPSYMVKIFNESLEVFIWEDRIWEVWSKIVI